MYPGFATQGVSPNGPALVRFLVIKKKKKKKKKDVNGKCIFHKDKSSPHSVFPLLLALLKTAQDTIMFNRQQTEKKKKKAV